MRNNLGKLGNSKRHHFIATFVKYGFKNQSNYRMSTNHYVATILFKDLKDKHGKILINHLWVNCTKRFRKWGQFIEGDKISFNGRVATYTKGYQGIDPIKRKEHPIRKDYKLEYPSKVQLITTINETRKSFPEKEFDFCCQIYDRYRSDYMKRGIRDIRD